MVLGRRAVFGVDQNIGRGERRIRVADLRHMLMPFGNLGRVLFLQALVTERRTRFVLGIGGLHLVGRFARGFERVGHHHGDDLPVMRNLRAELLDRCRRTAAAELDLLQLGGVVLRQYIEHTGYCARRLGIQANDPALGNRAGHEEGVGRIADREIGGITRLAGDLEPGVQPGDRLSHIGFGFGCCIGGHVTAPWSLPAAARGPAYACLGRP